LAAAALLLALAAGCAVNPVTGRSELHLVSEQEEIAMGRTNYVPGQQQSGGQYVVDAPLTAYVREVGQKLAQVSDRRQLPYEFVVLNESVPNAWAMPGGKIAVNRGLLTELKSEAELAAVIGHEIVHAAGRHAARGMESGLLIQAGAAVISAATADRQYGRVVDAVAGVGAGLLGVKYGRDLELEADHYGMIYMQRAGYDPQAAVSLQETFVRLAGNKEANWLAGLFASHPPSQERVDENHRFAATLGGNFKTGEKEYQARIAPLLKSRAAYKSFDEGEKALKNKDADKALQLADAALKIEPREAVLRPARRRLAPAEEATGGGGRLQRTIKRNADYEFYLGRGRGASSAATSTPPAPTSTRPTPCCRRRRPTTSSGRSGSPAATGARPSSISAPPRPPAAMPARAPRSPWPASTCRPIPAATWPPPSRRTAATNWSCWSATMRRSRSATSSSPRPTRRAGARASAWAACNRGKPPASACPGASPTCATAPAWPARSSAPAASNNRLRERVSGAAACPETLIPMIRKSEWRLWMAAGTFALSVRGQIPDLHFSTPSGDLPDLPHPARGGEFSCRGMASAYIEQREETNHA
jgi:hypothetical protein